MLDKYIIKNGKKLRYGYTTGSCAAAASKAAAIMAQTGGLIDRVTVDTPKGWTLHLSVLEGWSALGIASCSVRKDGGDDPDNTHGILISSTVEITEEPRVIIKGGEGVGIVTRRGLPVLPGKAAINPVPEMMIKKEVSEVLQAGKGAIVTISVPEGEIIAKKTFNPRLGIVGGISILGTTGIVEPMSEEAFKDSLALDLKMTAADGLKKLVLVPGNHGRDMAHGFFGIAKKKIVKTSNYIGFMLEKCVEAGIGKVLIIGHMGKLIKLAGGIFNTHSKVADGRMEILISNLALEGADKDLMTGIFDCITTDAAYDLVKNSRYKMIFDIISNKAEKKCGDYVHEQLKVGIVMFSLDKEIVGIGETAKNLLEEFHNE